MTRKEYNQTKSTLITKLEAVITKLVQASATSGASLANIDDWNNLHDEQYDLEQELKHLDRNWRTRKWSVTEWAQWELISQNID